MKKKLLIAVTVVVLGLAFTASTLLINRTSPFDNCEGFGLHQVQKGFPLPVILLKPSVSLCKPVESVLVLLGGNAYHEEYPLNALVDIAFWSSLSAVGIVGLIKLKKSK